MDEAADMRRAIQESLELERQEKERAEREYLEDLARIREAEEAELKELGTRLMRRMNNSEERGIEDIGFRTKALMHCISYLSFYQS